MIFDTVTKEKSKQRVRALKRVKGRLKKSMNERERARVRGREKERRR